MRNLSRRIAQSKKRLALAIGVAALVLGVVASPSWAAFGIKTWQTSLSGAQAGQAGGHADFTTMLEINNTPDPDPTRVPLPDGDTAKLVADLPPGMLGDPSATPKCSLSDFFNILALTGGCPAGAQVGLADMVLNGGNPLLSRWPTRIPVFNLEPRNDNELARFGLMVPIYGVPLQIAVRVRTESDYGVTAISDGLPHLFRLVSVNLTLWAEPGAASHDPQRYPPVIGDGKDLCGGVACVPGVFPLRPNPGLPPKPFLSSPTRCDGDLSTRMTATEYADFNSPVSADHVIPAMTNCDLVPFDPALTVTSRSSVVDSPSGFDVKLTLPPNTEMARRAQSHLRDVVMEMPDGVAINPSAAQGMEACTDSQLKIGTPDPADCPDAAQIGTLDIKSPALPGTGTLEGHVYQRPQLPDETFRVVLVAEGFGVNAKIPGVVRPDETTGKIVAIFDETPQLPFTVMNVRFDGGDRGVLVTPTSCGSHTAAGTFTPWSGQPAVRLASAINTSWDGRGAACPAKLPFDPTIAAGSQDGTAGATTDFDFRVQRGDRNQELRSVTVNTPKGLSAYVRGVPLCRSDLAAAGTCPESSRIGTVTSGAGAGNHPLYIKGRAYLTEGYKGAPYGLSIVVPAVAGPFDLGDVVVRSAIHVDRRTAELRVISDPLPRILEGVPLRIRDVRVSMDLERFVVNPTSCERMSIAAAISSDTETVTRTVPFRATGCAALPFKPRLSLQLTGRNQSTDGGHPNLKAVVRQTGIGEAGIQKAATRLPLSMALDPENAQDLCEFEHLNKDNIEDHCPKGSIIGRARAVSPLLNDPLVGNVYFVKNRRINSFGNSVATLPALIVALRGEVAVNLKATSSVERNRLVTTFDNVPDTPISRFNLNIKGGKTGILTVVRKNLCGRQVTEADFDGQNGKRRDIGVKMKTPCRKKVVCKTKKQKLRRACKRTAKRAKAVKRGAGPEGVLSGRS